MRELFTYNWQVRDEWFNWCAEQTLEELTRQRDGGVGSILQTLLHIIDVEVSWIRAVMGKPDVPIDSTEYRTLEEIRTLSQQLRPEIISYFDDDFFLVEKKKVYASCLMSRLTRRTLLPMRSFMKFIISDS
nr:DinB family protein [Geomicrobium sp. JCM 19037]